MEKFSVLPTDKRFLSLFEEQKIALFESINSLPDEKVLKKRILFNRKRKEAEEASPDQFVTPGMKKRMIEIFKAQGLNEEQVETRLKVQLKNIKDAELKNLDKMREEIDG